MVRTPNPPIAAAGQFGTGQKAQGAETIGERPKETGQREEAEKEICRIGGDQSLSRQLRRNSAQTIHARTISTAISSNRPTETDACASPRKP